MVQRKLLAIVYAIVSEFAGIYSLRSLLYIDFSYIPSKIFRIFFSSNCLPRQFLTVVVVAISVKSEITNTVPLCYLYPLFYFCINTICHKTILLVLSRKLYNNRDIYQ